MKTFISAVLLAISSISYTQINTEIYLFDLLPNPNNQSYQLANPINISQNIGYDNQPTFFPDGTSILYSRTVGGQTEIARYFLKNGKTILITNTLEGSEYSPTPMPNGDISSIRLDTTGLQLLYRYNLKGESRILVNDLVIGYHVWINENELVSFVLGDTITMQRVNTVTNERTVLAKNIGRSLHKVPNTNQFSYIDKSSEKWMINSRNIHNDTSITLIETIKDSEDYCWTPKGEIITGKGNSLWIWDKGKDWNYLADLTTFGLQGVSRIAVSPDGKKIVLVVTQ